MAMTKNSSTFVPSGAVTIAEAADYLRVSRASIWRLLKQGSLKRTRIGGRTVIRRLDLDVLLANGVEKLACGTKKVA